MYDITQIESQWRIYKRKKFIIYFVAFLLLFGAFLAVYFFWSSPPSTKNTPYQSERHASETDPKASHESLNERSPISPVPSTETPSHKIKGWSMTFSDGKVEDKQPSKPRVPTQHVDIEVTTKNSAISAHEIEERFRFAKDKDDALFLARYYYDKKAYKKALEWALETNKLDSDIEESWLIFGRAKVQLGQRIEAIRVLQAYYDRTGSPRAQKLLDAIRRGKMP